MSDLFSAIGRVTMLCICVGWVFVALKHSAGNWVVLVVAICSFLAVFAMLVHAEWTNTQIARAYHESREAFDHARLRTEQFRRELAELYAQQIAEKGGDAE